METQRDRPVERNVQKQDVEEAEVDENKITNAFANILMKFQQVKQKDANQSVEELQQLTKTTPVSTTNPPVIQIEDESSQDFEKVTSEPKVNEVVLEPQKPKQIVEERLQIDLQEQKEQPKNGRLSKKTTKENFPKNVVVVENELIESEKPPLKKSSSLQNTMQFGLQSAAPIKPKSKPSKEKANEVKQSKPSSKPIDQPPQNQESPALQTQQTSYITYKDRKLVRVIPIIEIQLQDLDGTEQNELFYESADNEALAFDQEEEQIEEEEPQHKIVDFQIEITLVAPQLTEKITRTAEEEPKEENKLQRMYVNKNEAMQPMPASKRQIKKSGKYQMPQQRISPKLNHQTNSTPVVSESNGALKHSKISTPPQDLPKQPSTRLSTSQLNGSVTNRMNLGSSTLLDIIQELFNLKVIGPGVHRQFYEYHSIRDIHDFLTKFKAGKLHKFDFSHFKFTILDHRRLTQLLLNMRPDKYYLGAINQRDGEIQQFLLNLYSLPGEDYYKLYSKIDNISQIKWWSKIVTANYDNLMENQAQQSLNKKKIEALNNVMNSVETKAEEQSNSIAMRSSTQERPKSTIRIVNEQQQVQKKMRESELGKIRNIVSNFGPKKQQKQVQQAKPDDSGVRMRKKIKFY